MILGIVFGVISFVWGVVVLTGRVDKWLIYAGKQMNEKRLRYVSGIGYLLGGVLFTLEGFLGYNSITNMLIWVFFIVILTLQYTWCRKMPEN